MSTLAYTLGGQVDFVEASDTLKKCLTDEDIAREAGVSVQLIRQTRLSGDSPSRRSPPPGWADAIARLARQRAQELLELADRVDDL